MSSPVLACPNDDTPMVAELEELIQTTYDSGYYAARGDQVGITLHRIARAERNKAWRKIAHRLVAAEELATTLAELVDAAADNGYISESALKPAHAALRQYQEIIKNG